MNIILQKRLKRMRRKRNEFFLQYWYLVEALINSRLNSSVSPEKQFYRFREKYFSGKSDKIYFEISHNAADNEFFTRKIEFNKRRYYPRMLFTNAINFLSTVKRSICSGMRYVQFSSLTVPGVLIRRSLEGGSLSAMSASMS